MRKLSSLFIVISMILILAACGNDKVDKETADKYIAKAEEVVHHLNGAQYDLVYEQFNKTMKIGLPVEEMEGLTPLIEASGDFEQFGDAVVELNDDYYVVVIEGEYSEDKRVYTISFNEADEIGGLYIK